MSEPRPTARVRVTGPARHPHQPRARTGDIDEQTALGGVYVDSLLREQLALALRVLGVLALTVGGIPLLFHLVPDLADVDVAGLPLAWLLIGVLVYPWLLTLGLAYVRRAERNERNFVLIVQATEDEE